MKNYVSVAAINTNRDFIGIELDEHYFQIAQERIETAKSAALDEAVEKICNN